VKLITAIVRQEKLDDVEQAVIEAKAHGMTVTEVRGFGQQFGHVPGAYPADRESLLLPKLRVDVVVQDQEAGLVADAIASAVKTGDIGDGKIWISRLEDAIRVRTGERGPDAV
jgi:nitrogen regulatory protein P-II 1